MRLLTAMVAAFVCSPAIAADYLGKVLAVSDGDTFTMEADVNMHRSGTPGYVRPTG